LGATTAAWLGWPLSPDGARLAALTSRGLLVWDLAERVVIARIPTGGNYAAFTPDGERLVVAVPAENALAPASVRVYLVSIADVAALARGRLTRAWSPNECQRFLHTSDCPPAP
jgi:hypothetical protein